MSRRNLLPEKGKGSIVSGWKETTTESICERPLMAPEASLTARLVASAVARGAVRDLYGPVRSPGTGGLTTLPSPSFGTLQPPRARPRAGPSREQAACHSCRMGTGSCQVARSTSSSTGLRCHTSHALSQSTVTVLPSQEAPDGFCSRGRHDRQSSCVRPLRPHRCPWDHQVQARLTSC